MCRFYYMRYYLPCYRYLAGKYCNTLVSNKVRNGKEKEEEHHAMSRAL